jgi:uncharacterized protein (DUF1697 family)
VSTYVALFRGINVGGKNILPMKDLVGILESMGCEIVKTYIQSGNAVFQLKGDKTKKIAEEISSKILESHGFEAKVHLMTIDELSDAVENNPFKKVEGKSLHFFFLTSAPAKPNLDDLTKLKSDSEKFKLHNNIFYLYAPDGIGRSKLAAKVEKALGVPATARNWNTVSKLMAMVHQA